MTDTEILDAIIEHQLWVHPAGNSVRGWTARGPGWTASGQDKLAHVLAYNKPTLRDAVIDAVNQIELNAIDQVVKP